MSEGRVERRLAAILAVDVAGYSRLTGADEEGTLRRLRQLRAELFDPAIEGNGGRIFKRTGDGILAEFASVVDAVRCAIGVQQGLLARNADIAPERRIEVRVGIHLGDVIVEDDGDLMGDGVNIAARLEGIAPQGGICLSRAAYDQVEGKVTEEFRDIGDQALKNIARPVRVFAIDSAAAAAPQLPVLASGPPRLSIVVLPFANIGGDPEQDYFVDGVTESLTTDLSRLAGSFVIARNTAFTYKGKPHDATKIGRELGVRYVLEGSVQRGGNRMRLNVQLIDAETGHHLWAERFDKAVGDLFDMQDEIVARLANELSTALIAQEARRAAKAPNPDSLDHYFQGTAWYEKAVSRENLSEARRCFERALALDPGNVDALVGLATMDSIFATVFTGDDREARFAGAEAAAKKGLSLAPNHAVAHFVLGTIYVWTHRAEEAVAEFERAIELDRNLAFAHAYTGCAKYALGRAEEAEAHVREALRLSPRDAFTYVWLSIAGFAKLCLREYEEAVAWLRHSIEANRNFTNAYFNLAAALAHLGRIDEAKSAAKAGLALDPTRTIRSWRARNAPDHPAFVTQLEHVLDGMRIAGVPEG
ncbi:MAG TPA: tetratricopeptide repeat protein [Rhizobiaceae bacterium]|nr:tetratricopeptide repeat protein [Rhizobiaceae bacterium]